MKSKSKYNGIYLYEDSDYIVSRRHYTPGEVTPYRIALQQGDTYAEGDFSISIFYSTVLGRDVVTFPEVDLIKRVYDPAPTGPSARICLDPEKMRNSWLKNLSFGELLMILQYLYKCVSLGGSLSWVREINKVSGTKKHEWLPWFEYAAGIFGKFVQKWLLDRKDRLDCLKVESTKCYRLNTLTGKWKCDEHGAEMDCPAYDPELAREMRWCMSYDTHRATLFHFDESGRPVEFHCIEGDQPSQPGFKSEYTGGDPDGMPTVAVEEPAAPAWQPKSIGVNADARRIFGLMLRPVYDILERDCSGGKEYLKVINDSGQEVWVGRGRVISVL